jgi:hypothetical protein
MTSPFDRELMAMERETRDLKTVHQRGLGATRFYRKTYIKSNAAQGFHTFHIRIYDGEPMPAIILAHINTPTPTGTPSVTIIPRPYGADAIVYSQAGEIRVDAISSGQIEEIF